MALSQSEHAEVLDKIGELIGAEFANVISRYYALSVSYSGRHPQNVNNELRNAVTHMSRALVSDTIEAARRQLEAAERHVERFKRDCLKIAVIYASKNTGDIIKTAHSSFGNRDPYVALEALAIVRQRYGIIISEVRGDPEIAASWEALLLRIERLRERVLSANPLLDIKKHLWFFAVHWFLKVLKQLWILVGMAILAMMLFTVIVPNQQEFGTHAQELIAGVTRYLLVRVRPQ